jgi:hypothetical protein
MFNNFYSFGSRDMVPFLFSVLNFSAATNSQYRSSSPLEIFLDEPKSARLASFGRG